MEKEENKNKRKQRMTVGRRNEKRMKDICRKMEKEK